METMLIFPQKTAFGYEYLTGERMSVKLKDSEELLRKRECHLL